MGVLSLCSVLLSWSFPCVLPVCLIKTQDYRGDSHHRELFVDKISMESTTTFSICIDIFIRLQGILNGTWNL